MRRLLFVLSTAALLAAGCSSKSIHRIDAAGVIDGSIIHIKSGTSGAILSLNAKEGSMVQKGDTLAVIDLKKNDNQIQELCMQEKSVKLKRSAIVKKREFLSERLKYLKEQVNKLKRLSKHDAVSEDNLKVTELKKEEAETSLFETNVQIKSTDLELERIATKKEYLNLVRDDHIITAPAGGTVLEVFSNAGEQVFPRDMIADLLDNSSMYADIFLEEEEVNSLALGDTAKIVIDGIKSELKGVVSYFGTKAEFSPKYIISEKERKNLLYEVKVSIDPNDAQNVKIGQLVSIVFSGREK